MIDEEGKSLWERVCSTVTRLGTKEFAEQYLNVWRDDHPATLDLHGMTVQEAYEKTRAFLFATPHKRVTIITGLSGQIRAEFLEWIRDIPRVRYSDPLNGGGAFAVHLRPR